MTIVCGPHELDSADEHAVINPTLIIEVLSRSTEGYDRGDKFEHYKSLASLQQYVLISPRERSLEVWTREGGERWVLATVGEGEPAELSSIGALLDVRELFDAAEPPSPSS